MLTTDGGPPENRLRQRRPRPPPSPRSTASPRAAGDCDAPADLRQRACQELLRQRPSARPAGRHRPGAEDGVPATAASAAIEAAHRRGLDCPSPTRRPAAATSTPTCSRLPPGDRTRAHVLLAVTAGVNVGALRRHAEGLPALASARPTPMPASRRPRASAATAPAAARAASSAGWRPRTRTEFAREVLGREVGVLPTPGAQPLRPARGRGARNARSGRSQASNRCAAVAAAPARRGHRPQQYLVGAGRRGRGGASTSTRPPAAGAVAAPCPTSCCGGCGASTSTPSPAVGTFQDPCATASIPASVHRLFRLAPGALPAHGHRPGRAVPSCATSAPSCRRDGSAGDHGTAAAIEFGTAVLNLAVARIVVCGHSHCGGIRALYEARPPAPPTWPPGWSWAARRCCRCLTEALRRTEQRAVAAARTPDGLPHAPWSRPARWRCTAGFTSSRTARCAAAVPVAHFRGHYSVPAPMPTGRYRPRAEPPGAGIVSPVWRRLARSFAERETPEHDRRPHYPRIASQLGRCAARRAPAERARQTAAATLTSSTT